MNRYRFGMRSGKTIVVDTSQSIADMTSLVRGSSERVLHFGDTIIRVDAIDSVRWVRSDDESALPLPDATSTRSELQEGGKQLP